jgi:DNA recombination protein RmuC
MTADALIAALTRWPPDWTDPATAGLAVAAALALWTLAALRRAAHARALAQGQERLAGALSAGAAAQARAAEAMERRLSEVERRMAETLAGGAQRTARSLGELQARLTAIDRAQAKIERLSGEVLGLQDILSNKQARGAFGEIQLADILRDALPPDAYALQATLSNGRRADALLALPEPPGRLAVDAKFPLEGWQALRAARDDRARAEADRAFRASVRAHVAAIAERYVIEGETAEGALMFVPSEAVYAELHGRFGDVVREGFARKVWIVSPTTLMATLTTLRAVMRDARLSAQAAAVRRELGLLHRDMERLSERVGALDRHFEAARRDVEAVRISAEKAGARAARLEGVEFGDAPATEAAE